MEPLDDEAQALSDKCRHKWEHPIESLPTQMSPGEASFMQAMMKMMEGQPASTKGVDPKEFAALQEQVAALMERNKQLEAVAAAKPVPSARRA